eukprot:1151251-Pelagomonas_calceolata.AAC.2
MRWTQRSRARHSDDAAASVHCLQADGQAHQRTSSPTTGKKPGRSSLEGYHGRRWGGGMRA